MVHGKIHLLILVLYHLKAVLLRDYIHLTLCDRGLFEKIELLEEAFKLEHLNIKQIYNIKGVVMKYYLLYICFLEYVAGAIIIE